MATLRRLSIWLLVFLLLPMTIADSEEVSGPLSNTNRKEVANASQILDRYLKKKCYDKKTRPNVTGGPEMVNVSIGVKSFSEIRESNMEFQVFLYVRQEWTDKRLAHGIDASLALSGADVQRMWLPDTYFTNANEHEVFTSNQLALIDKNGMIYYSAYVRVAGACHMNLVKFPMDVQQCELTLESFAYTIEQMDFQWKEHEPIRILNEELAEFDVVKYDLSARKISYVSGSYKDLAVTFTFHRRMGFYFIQFYIPCIVMVSLSWISFWMDRYYIGERLSLGITTILTIVFLLGSSNSTMPRVSYAKAIDWYLLGSFIFVFSTLVTDLLVYRLRSREEEQQKEENKENKIVFQCKHGFKPNYVADANGGVHLVSYQDNSREERKACLSDVRTCCMGCTQATPDKKTDLSVLTNKCCRYMYPISFAIFNLVYWLALSTGN